MKVARRKFLELVSLGWITSFLPWRLDTTGSNSRIIAQSVSSLCPIQPTNISTKTKDVLKKIVALNNEFPEIGVYHKTTDQDRVGSSDSKSLIGIHPCNGTPNCKESDSRSEKVYLPFVMSTRRQTDSMVRQAYRLLPEKHRKTTAFLIIDRLLQYPECYIPYIEKKENVVLIGSFSGIGKGITDKEKYNGTDNGSGAKTFHSLQLRQLEYAIQFIESLNKPIIDIVFSMGDSPSTYAEEIRKEKEKDVIGIIQKNCTKCQLYLSDFELSWGADDTVLKAFARRLGNDFKLKVVIEDPFAENRYEANKTTKEIVKSQIKSLLIKEDENSFTAQVFIFSRDPKKPRESQQAEDKNFRKKYLLNIPKNQYSKSIIVDGREPNGALNLDSLPPSDEFLAYGSWGTFSNALVQTLSIAKILHYSQVRNKEQVQRQFLLEAVAHDAFFIGYEQAQSPNSPLRKKLLNYDVTYCGNDYPYTKDDVIKIYKGINDFVNEQISSKEVSEKITGIGATKFTFVPQLWRAFESEVYASDGQLSFAGVYRTDLDQQTFNPTRAAQNVKKFNLEDLINEFP
jgi:hypothetical protein